MMRRNEFCLDPTFPGLPKGPPTRGPKPHRRVLGIGLVMLLTGFVGGTLAGGMIGRDQARAEIEAARNEARVGAEVVEDLTKSIDLWRNRALACYSPEFSGTAGEGTTT